MSPSSLCNRIILCGPAAQSLLPLANILRASASTPVEIRHGSAFETAPVEGATLVTTNGPDVLGLKKMRAWSDEEQATTRIVICIRDPRNLLMERCAEANGEYRCGFDHSLNVAGEIITLTGPGLTFVHEVGENAARRNPNILILRHEDLVLRPKLVQLALSRFTGLDLTKAFDGLLLNEPLSSTSFKALAATNALPTEDRARIVRQFRLAPDLFDILSRFDYEAAGDRAWFDDLAGRSPEAMDDTPGMIVGYHTSDALYSAEAKRLRRSIKALGLPLELSVLPREEGWLSAVQKKPRFLLEQRRLLRGPLLYVDVDAVIHADPWPYLRGYDGDVAVAGHHGQAIISGTILINDTPGAAAFLEEWAMEQERSPESWDQHCLEAVAKKRRRNSDGVRVQYLPPAMCCVFNRRFTPPITPIIEHLQASREQFAGSTDEGGLANLASRRARLAELDARNAAAPENKPAPTDSSPSTSGLYAALSPEERSDATLHLIAVAASDIDRWTESANLKSAWKTRARAVAALIAPGSVVLDLGCGTMDLEQALPFDATYIPVDLVARDERTIIVDLNSGPLPQVDADVVTMLGVLEYVHRPEELLIALAKRWPRLVISYNPIDLDEGRNRRAHGWFSDLTSSGLVAAATRAGYRLEAVVPHGLRERVYDFAWARA